MQNLPVEEAEKSPEEITGENIPLLPLREDIRLFEGGFDAGGSPIWQVFDPTRNLYFRVNFTSYSILARWNLARDVKHLVELVNTETVLNIDAKLVIELASRFRVFNMFVSNSKTLCESLLQQRNTGTKSLSKTAMHSYLFFRIPLIRPDRFLHATYPYVKFLFGRGFAICLLLMGISGIYLVSRQFDQFLTSYTYFFSLEGAAYYMIAIAGAKIIHEFGHAYTAKSFNCSVSTMGIAFMVLFPILFTDTTDAWKLRSKHQRIKIAMAGMMAELSLAVISLFAWCLLPDGPLRSAAFMLCTTTWILTLFVNLNPLMRFDGYYLMQDIAGVDNLQTRGFAHGKWYLREKLFGFGLPPPDLVTRRVGRFFCIYSYCTWIYRFFLFLGIAALVYYLFFKLLGIILLIIEILWFILLPILKEFVVWWKMREKVRLNTNTLITVFALLFVLTLFFFPWKSNLELAAILQSKSQYLVYTPYPGRFVKSYVEEGDWVEKDVPLFEIDEPLLRLEKIKESYELEKNLITREQEIDSDQIKGQSQVTEQKIAESRKKIASLQDQLDQSIVRSSEYGKVVSIFREVKSGEWLANDTQVMTIANPRSPEVVTYFEEKDLDRFSLGDGGIFYPDNVRQASFPVTITKIHFDSAKVLREAMLGSVSGGTIPVRMGEKNKLHPEVAVYKVELRPDSSVSEVDKEIRGRIIIAGERISLFSQVWRQVAQVLIRESGF